MEADIVCASCMQRAGSQHTTTETAKDRSSGLAGHCQYTLQGRTAYERAPTELPYPFGLTNMLQAYAWTSRTVNANACVLSNRIEQTVQGLVWCWSDDKWPHSDLSRIQCMTSSRTAPKHCNSGHDVVKVVALENVCFGRVGSH